jgi:hypothetical protein
MHVYSFFLMHFFSFCQSKASCGMFRSGSGLGNSSYLSKSVKLRETPSSQSGTNTMSKIFEEGTMLYKILSNQLFVFLKLQSYKFFTCLAFSWSSKHPRSVEV